MSKPVDSAVSTVRFRENRLSARGAADDKGQVFFPTLGVRAHLAAIGRTTPAEKGVETTAYLWCDLAENCHEAH